MQRQPARDALLDVLSDNAAMGDPKFRSMALTAVAEYDTQEVGEAIAPFAESDPSSKVEADASLALGGVLAFDAQDILVANADKESYSYQIRTAAIEALGKRNDPKAIDVSLKYAAYGRHDRVRPVAIRALGKLAKENIGRRKELRATIKRFLTDPQDRAVTAAIEALATIGDDASLDIIRAWMPSAIKRSHYFVAVDALANARPEGESPGIDALQSAIDKLRQDMRSMQQRIEKQ